MLATLPSPMNPLRLLPLLALLLAGCSGSTPVAEDLSTSSVRRVADTAVLSVYVVRVDGRDYLVVNTMHGVSVCPKTP